LSERPLILNRYRPLETRGKGGFGTVDVAWDTRLRRRVAIKRIPLRVDATDLPGIQEARTAALLNNPNIVQVLDFEVTGTEALLIMENVDGPTLGEILRQSSELLDLDTVTAVLTGIAAALECAHENQVLHLDIKPANVLIDHAGHIKVTDFGLSELSGTAGFAEPQGGTIGYMPPEQLAAAEVDPRTDLWALAALTYQLLTGTNPFFSTTTAESLRIIEDDPITLPSALNPNLDPVADEVLFKALAADKDERYPSVSAFVEALRLWLGDEQAGRRALKMLAGSLDEDVEGDGGDTQEWDGTVPTQVPLWERLSERSRGILARLTAGVACGTTAWLGLSGFHWLDPALPVQALPDLPVIAHLGLVLMVALAGCLAPQLGGALAFLALAAGLFVLGSPLLGALLLVGAAAWWVLCGRRGPVDTAIVTLVPLLSTLWIPFAAPLFAGSLLPWRRTVGAALASGVLIMLLAPLTGAPEPYRTGLEMQLTSQPVWDQFVAAVTRPASWIAVVGWVLSALLMVPFARRGTRMALFLGTILATAVLVLATVAAPLALEPSLGLTTLVDVAFALLLSFVVVNIGIAVGMASYSIPDEDEE
jgi:hypothetical protein